jgi:hypothetical protein
LNSDAVKPIGDASWIQIPINQQLMLAQHALFYSLSRESVNIHVIFHSLSMQQPQIQSWQNSDRCVPKPELLLLFLLDFDEQV